MGRLGVRVESRGGFCHTDRSQESTFGAAGVACPNDSPTIPTIPENLDNAAAFVSVSTSSTFALGHEFGWNEQPANTNVLANDRRFEI